MDSRSFLDNLKESGLLPEDQVAQVSGRFSNSAMQVIVADLVDEGLLTPFQVKQLHAGQPKGLVLGQYHLLDELGRGGYGCVYKAQHKLMNRIVALKVIAPERVEDSRARAWFRREVLAATQLTHPNIALAYDADEIDGVLFFAMEYIDGLNLDTLVRQRGPVPIGTACEMLLQTAKALQYAHEKGMVHRDIKPANLLIPGAAITEAATDFAPQAPAAGRPVLVKVVDFGLARLQSSSANNTLLLQNERSFVGTPAYVSPEQARNVHEVDIRSDLYSLGCTFYFALTGRPPFQASTPLQIIVQHLEKEPAAIEKHRPEIPSALASIIRRLMAKKPEKRFQTPGELLGELGFFYALDRSGVQRSIPFPSVGVTFSRNETPADVVPSIAPESVPEYEYSPTRVLLLDEEKRAAAEPLAAGAPPKPSVAPPPTVLGPGQIAATVTYIPAVPPVSLPPDVTTEAPAQPLDQDLIPCWQEWESLVADLTTGRTLALDDRAYRLLHRRLLAACHAQAASVGLTHGALSRRIADLVQPWLTLATLSATDHETLASLYQQCRAINEKLGVGHGALRWISAAFLLLLGASFIYLTLQFVASSPASSWSGLIQRHPVVSLVLLLPLVLISSVLLMRKLFRTTTS